MTYTGIIHGTSIQFERSLPFMDGAKVVVDIRPSEAPRKGSPQAWLTRMAGTLTSDEAECILSGANACRTIDGALWSPTQS